MPTVTFILLLVLPAALVVASAAVLVYALRGRRIDDHPVCRRCGFDLFGKPEGTAVCSECGANLRHPDAVRVGRREKRWRLAGVAAPVLLACVAWFGVLGWGAARGTDWNQRKPVWWLMREARGGHAATRDAALVELTERMVARKLTQPQIDALVDLALEKQADRSRPWVAGWGDAIDAAQSLGVLAPEKWRRYAVQGIEMKLEVRPTLRRGDRLVYRFVPWGPRLSAGTAFRVRSEPGPLRIGDTPLVREPGRPQSLPVHGVSVLDVPVRTAAPDREALAALPDGPHTLRMTVRLQISNNPRGGFGTPLPPPDELGDQTVEVTAPLTLLPAGAEAVKVRTDPELKAAMQGAFTIAALELTPSRPMARVRAEVVPRRPPVSTAFRVIARRDGQEWDLGPVHFSAGATGRYTIDKPVAQLPGFDTSASTVDVVLKPSVEAALATLDVTEIWGGEVVLKDVPVRPAAPTSRPVRRTRTRPATGTALPLPTAPQ